MEGSLTCRSSSLGSGALTTVDYTPVPSLHLLGKRLHDPSVLESSQLCGPGRRAGGERGAVTAPDEGRMVAQV